MSNATRSCRQCGDDISGHPARVYCSNKCRYAYKAYAQGPSCTVCGEKMMRGTGLSDTPAHRACRERIIRHGTTSEYKRGCRCDECRLANTEYMRQYVEDYTAKHGVSPTAHLKRKRNGHTGETQVCTACGEPMLLSNFRSDVEPRHRHCRGRFYVSPGVRLSIYERDSWVCHLCGEPVNTSGYWSSDRYPSLDHIIPRSRGGSDDMDNLATAHRRCNSIRGASEMDTAAA